ncbi:hypothetical protein [Parasphingorhabdus sp.]|uniref:hypothetical protein n=1 Tax=Parasphingorhabdus sp. TaxID=2709688 RepID=UPI003A916953
MYPPKNINAPNIRRRKITPRAINYILISIIVISLYLNLGMTISGFYIPMFGVYIGAGVLLIFKLYQQKKLSFFRDNRLNKDISTALLFSLSWIITIPFSPGGLGYVSEHLKSVALLSLSTISAVIVFYEILQWKHSKLGRYFLIISLFLTTYAVLETMIPFFRDISNDFRSVLYTDRFIYGSNKRDLVISGFIRPNVFTQEPSHLAKMLAISTLLYFVSNKGRGALQAYIALTIIQLLFTGSPTILVGPVLLTIFYFWKTIDTLNVGFSLYLKILALVGVLIGVLFAQQIISLLPSERAALIASGRDASFVIRTLGPATIAWDTISAYPWAGSGIGGRELVQDILIKAYREFPSMRVERFDENIGYAGWGNAFFEIFTYSGFVCGLILIPALIILLKRFRAGVLSSILIFLVIFNMDAGFTSVRPWIYFAFTMIALKLWYSQNSELNA